MVNGVSVALSITHDGSLSRTSFASSLFNNKKYCRASSVKGGFFEEKIGFNSSAMNHRTPSVVFIKNNGSCCSGTYDFTIFSFHIQLVGITTGVPATILEDARLSGHATCCAITEFVDESTVIATPAVLHTLNRALRAFFVQRTITPTTSLLTCVIVASTIGSHSLKNTRTRVIANLRDVSERRVFIYVRVTNRKKHPYFILSLLSVK